MISILDPSFIFINYYFNSSSYNLTIWSTVRVVGSMILIDSRLLDPFSSSSSSSSECNSKLGYSFYFNISGLSINFYRYSFNLFGKSNFASNWATQINPYLNKVLYPCVIENLSSISEIRLFSYYIDL